MAIENKLVKFGYGFNAAESAKEGMLSFDASAQAIYVGDGTTANLVTSRVKDATYVDNVLTITKIDGTQHTLNFSDVASAKQTMAVFAALETKLGNIDSSLAEFDTAINQNITNIEAIDTSYKAADASIREDVSAVVDRIEALEGAIGENGSVATQIANAIDALAGSAEDVDDSSLVKVAVESENGEVKTVTVTTYDIAKASDLSGHTGNGDIHVTKEQKEAWQAATDKVDAFFNDAVIDNADQLKDTLKEIQDYIASDASAAATMAENITKAQAAADKAQGEVDALENVVAGVKTTADGAAAAVATKAEQNDLNQTNANLKAVTDSYVISFGGAKGAIAIDTANGAAGDVKFAMDGSTLTGHVEGLGSAAFTEASAYDAAGTGEAKANAVKQAVIGVDGDASTADTIYGAKKYAAEVAAAAKSEAEAAALVTGVNGDAVADASNYVSIALGLDNKNVKVASVSVDTQAVADAGESAKGLAEASDVKAYVDTQIEANALVWKVL